jgi:hypothetical protein
MFWDIACNYHLHMGWLVDGGLANSSHQTDCMRLLARESSEIMALVHPCTLT